MCVEIIRGLLNTTAAFIRDFLPRSKSFSQLRRKALQSFKHQSRSRALLLGAMVQPHPVLQTSIPNSTLVSRNGAFLLLFLPPRGAPSSPSIPPQQRKKERKKKELPDPSEESRNLSPFRRSLFFQVESSRRQICSHPRVIISSHPRVISSTSSNPTRGCRDFSRGMKPRAAPCPWETGKSPRKKTGWVVMVVKGEGGGERRGCKSEIARAQFKVTV